ncbi:MAG: hypothetical protein VCC00_09035 [Deltaproteobacteria bacterium]
MGSRRSIIAAAAAYLLLIFWMMSGIAAAPARLVLTRPFLDSTLRVFTETDQKMVIATVAHAARGWLDPEHSLLADATCFPMPDAWTLGEHMLGAGLLAAVPLALTQQPILAFNLMLVFTLWIPAIGTFALVRRLTGSAPAAFVAGLFAGFTLDRVVDTIHPYVHGDLWVPLALLCLHESFRRGGWTAALGLMLTSALCLLESYYSMLAAAIILGMMTFGLSVRTGRAGLRRAAPALLLTGVACAAVAAFVFLPYVETSRIWGTSAPSNGGYGLWYQILPGWSFFPGILLVGLAFLGPLLLPVLPREERKTDFRLFYLGIALFLWFCSILELPLPGGITIPGPLALLHGILPGLDSVRALSVLATAISIPLSIAAGISLSHIFARRSTAFGWALALLLSTGFIVERFHDDLSRALTGSRTHHKITEIAPYPVITSILRQATGPVLSLNETLEQIMGRADRVFWTAWTKQPTSACYNSHENGLAAAVRSIARELPAPHAIDALVSLGFANLLVDHARQKPALEASLRPLAQGDLSPGIELIDRAGEFALYQLSAEPQPSFDWADLRSAQEASPPTPVRRDSGYATIEFGIENASARTFRLPDPLRPQPFEVRWTSREGDPPHSFRLPLLPIVALGPGGALRHALRVPAAVPDGHWRVELIPQALGRPIAAREVQIR